MYSERKILNTIKEIYESIYNELSNSNIENQSQLIKKSQKINGYNSKEDIIIIVRSKYDTVFTKIEKSKKIKMNELEDASYSRLPVYVRKLKKEYKK